MAKAVQCADDLNVSSERFHCVRKQYIFWRFTLSTGHSVYDILNKRLDKGGDALCLILVVRVSLIIQTRNPSRWFGIEIWPQIVIFSKEWVSCPVGWLIESEWTSDVWCWNQSLRMNLVLESVIPLIPPDNVNDYSFENKKVIGRTVLLGMMSFLMYNNIIKYLYSAYTFSSKRFTLLQKGLNKK